MLGKYSVTDFYSHLINPVYINTAVTQRMTAAITSNASIEINRSTEINENFNNASAAFSELFIHGSPYRTWLYPAEDCDALLNTYNIYPTEKCIPLELRRFKDKKAKVPDRYIFLVFSKTVLFFVSNKPDKYWFVCALNPKAVSVKYSAKNEKCVVSFNICGVCVKTGFADIEMAKQFVGLYDSFYAELPSAPASATNEQTNAFYGCKKIVTRAFPRSKFRDSVLLPICMTLLILGGMALVLWPLILLLVLAFGGGYY